jgi:dynein heavy chain
MNLKFQIERTFLSPYYTSLSKQEKELGLTPLLEDFDSEIAIYVNAQEKIKTSENNHDIEWIRINLALTMDVLVTLTNKLIWKFTNFLASQVKKKLVKVLKSFYMRFNEFLIFLKIKTVINEMELFLKRMEPDIEKITGEERDTATFMKIMRMFNEVSSKQTELEIKFELIKRTINLLKKYKYSDIIDLESTFNNTPSRWNILKSKVNLAKQRLGPTINQESGSIIRDLKDFLVILNNLMSDMQNSYLFNRDCEQNRAFRLLDDFTNKFDSYQNHAEDLRQLQELLDKHVVDFNVLTKAKITLANLKQTWKSIR